MENNPGILKKLKLKSERKGDVTAYICESDNTILRVRFGAGQRGIADGRLHIVDYGYDMYFEFLDFKQGRFNMYYRADSDGTRSSILENSENRDYKFQKFGKLFMPVFEQDPFLRDSIDSVFEEISHYLRSQ